MKPRTVSMALPLLLGLSLGSLAAQDQPAAQSTTWLIAVGIQAYEDDARIPVRKGATITTQAIYYYYVDEYHGNIGVDHARLLTDFAASKEAVQKAFADIAASAGREDQVVIYLALRAAVAPDAQGGAPDGLGKYLLPYDAKLEDLAASAISFQELAGWLGALKAKHKVLFLDVGPQEAIHAPGVQEGAKIDPGCLAPLVEATGIVSATDGAKPLFEEPLDRPVVGFCLYTAMQGPGDFNRNGLLTFDEFGQYAARTAGAVYADGGGRVPQSLVKGVPARLVLAKVPVSDPRCPVGMRLIDDTFCMDQYEAPNQPGAPVYRPGDWFSATAVCQQAGKRVCTVEEWEKACSGPGFMYPYGNSYVDGVCNIGQEEARMERVASRPGCVSAYGVYDLIGNAREWVGVGQKENAGVLGGSHHDLGGQLFGCSAQSGIFGNPILEGDDLTVRCCADPQG